MMSFENKQSLYEYVKKNYQMPTGIQSNKIMFLQEFFPVKKETTTMG